MKKVHLLLTLIICVIIFQHCEFQPNSENYIEITQPDTSKTIQISLSPLETEYIFTVPTEIYYDLNTFGLKIYNVEFFIETQSIHKGSEVNGHFTFYPSPWGIGPQTLTMIITTNTNTGSLADLLEAEGFIFQHTWNVLLDGGNPNPVVITDIFNDDGILKIEWEEYERFNFQKYVVYKHFYNKEWEGEKHILAEIYDPRIHELYDTSFIGDTAIYWVEIYASNQKAVSQKKQYMYETTSLLDTIWVNDNSAKFIWRKNPFYKAVKKVTLTTPNYYPRGLTELFLSENTSDTSCVVEGLKFGTELNYTLSVYPKSDIQIYQDNQNLRSSITFGIGKSLQKFDNIIGSPLNNYLYLTNLGKIFQYSFPDYSLKSITEGGFNSTCFISNFNYSLCNILNYEMKIYPQNNLSEFKIINNWDLGFHGYFSNSSISSNNRIIGAVGFGIGLYDLSSNEMVFTQNEGVLTGCTLSPDGKYAINYQMPGVGGLRVIRIYEVSNTELKLIWELPFGIYSQASWIPGTEHQLYVLEGYEFPLSNDSENNFIIYDAASLNIINNLTVKVAHFTGIDIFNKRVAFWDQIPNDDRKNKLFIYNYETGNLEKEILLAPHINTLYFWNSYLFSSEGFSINTSNFY